MGSKRTIKRICQVCEKEFYAIPYDVRKGRALNCSYKCMGIANRGKNNPQWKGGKVRRVCKECGREFYTFPVEIRKGKAHYCSTACAGKARCGENNSNWKPKVEKTCLYCEICRKQLKKSQTKYCSRNCFGKAQHKIARYCKICRKQLKKSQTKYCSLNCYGKANRGKNNSGWKPKVEKTCPSCGEIFYMNPSLKLQIYCSRRCFAKEQARNYKGYSKGRGGKREDLGNLYVRSIWEANYARYLNWLISQGKIKGWEYEPKTFEFEAIKKGTRFYTPDFQVIYNNGKHEWHEVKGYMDKRSATKLKRMAKYYPEEKIVLIDQSVYTSLSRIFRKTLPYWEQIETWRY